jgi:hypothetical protein
VRQGMRRGPGMMIRSRTQNVLINECSAQHIRCAKEDFDVIHVAPGRMRSENPAAVLTEYCGCMYDVDCRHG